METTEPRKETRPTPGVWSTDEYIRRWARNQGLQRGECVIDLQSLHGRWRAHIDFDQAGQPVHRVAVPGVVPPGPGAPQ